MWSRRFVRFVFLFIVQGDNFQLERADSVCRRFTAIDQVFERFWWAVLGIYSLINRFVYCRWLQHDILDRKGFTRQMLSVVIKKEHQFSSSFGNTPQYRIENGRLCHCSSLCREYNSSIYVGYIDGRITWCVSDFSIQMVIHWSRFNCSNQPNCML